MAFPACSDPAHAGSKVVRDGWYGETPHRRQRWRCTPPGGTSHRFSELLPREEPLEKHCGLCSTDLDEWQGQNGPQLYWFTARAIAHALYLVSKGTSYRETAKAVRLMMQRARPWKPRPGSWSRRPRNPLKDGQIVSNWVDTYTTIVSAGELPGSWPDRVTLDGCWFTTSSMATKRAGMQFNVFAAVGYLPEVDPRTELTVYRPHPWALSAYPKRGSAEWIDFFSKLRGQPEIVITDNDKSLRSAAMTHWPQWGMVVPDFRLCENHLRARAIEKGLHTHRDIVENRGHPIMKALAWAFISEANWDQFIKVIHNHIAQTGHHMRGMLRFISDYDREVRAQVKTRDFDGPYSTGSVEGVLAHVRDVLGNKRASSMTNLVRARKLLQLIQLDLMGKADEIKWAERIRDFLYLSNGIAIPIRTPGAPYRTADDRFGAWSLVS